MPAPLKRTYAKPALTPPDILSHLQGKGLEIDDIPAAIKVLETVGYFRLLIYCRAFQDNKLFRCGTKFSDIVNLYTFDRSLRLLCLDAIERLEVALRASINNRIAVAHGPHFYMDPIYFDRFSAFHRFAGHATSAQHFLTKNYYSTYTGGPEAPPIWILTEILSFGKLSLLFADLKIGCRKIIAADFGYDEGLLVSWFRCLTNFRNACAHHERIWDAQMLTTQPSRAKSLRELQEQDKLYARIVLMVALLRKIEPGEAWRNQLKILIATHPFVNPAEMGFPADWLTRPFWN